MQSAYGPVDAATKIALSLAVGLLVGLERQWAHKEMGVRSFALTALLGTLAWMVSPAFGVVAMIAALVLVALINAHSFAETRTIEPTTSAALIVTLILGALIGGGHYFTAVAAGLLMTGLLAWKTELVKLAGGLTLEEIRGAVLVGLLAFVIFPILPNHYIDKWNLLNPREAWITVVVLAAIGFLTYVLLRLYSAGGLYYSAILGALVNSTATVAQLSSTLADAGAEEADLVTASVMFAGAAMLVRNLVILGIFAPRGLRYGLVPILAMAVLSLGVAWWRRKKAPPLPGELGVGSPVSLRRVGSLAAIFVLIQIATALAARHTGGNGILAVSFLGGLVSSASTTAAAAVLAGDGRLSPQMAAAATVLACGASVVSHIALIRRRGAGRKAIPVVIRATAATLAVGIGSLVLWLHRVQ